MSPLSWPGYTLANIVRTSGIFPSDRGDRWDRQTKVIDREVTHRVKLNHPRDEKMGGEEGRRRRVNAGGKGVTLSEWLARQ